jgi:2-methylisocitrate lyase-like PEP mutase family enzyme
LNAASNDGSEKPHVKPTTKLKKLIHRDGKVLCILHTPTAAHARVMQEAGAEAAFVGTSGVVGTYTGMADVGTASMPECVQIAGWIANAVDFPIIMDGRHRPRRHHGGAAHDP